VCSSDLDQTPDKKRFAIFLKQLELSDLDTILQTLNIDAMKAYRGSVNVTAQGVLDTQTETTTINALANIEDLRVSDEYVNSQNEPLSFRADGLAYNAAAESISLKNLHVGHGSDLDFRIDDMVIQTGQTPKANGDITLEIDLGYIRRLIGAMLKPDEMKDLAGHLAYRCNLGADGTNLKLKGRGNIKGLVLERGNPDWGDIIFVHDLQLDTEADLLKISQMQLSSPAMNMKLIPPNTITDISGEKVMDLRGEFNGSWPRLIKLAQNFMPALKKDLALNLQGEMAANTGLNACEFTLTGPVNNPKLNPKFKSIRTQTAFGWESGQLLGLKLGGAKFIPDMRDGQIGRAHV